MKEYKKQPLSLCRSLAAAALIMIASTVVAAEDADSGADPGWQFAFDLYLWAPSISGDLKFTPPEASEGPEIDIDQFIDALQMAFMGSFEVRKGAWSGFTDLLYMEIAGDNSKSVVLPDDSSQILAEGELDFSAWVWTLGAAYNPWRSGNSHLDVFLGARVLGLDADLKITGLGPGQRAPELSESQEFWDGIVGVRGRAWFSEHWFIPYYLDLGAGDSESTWQASAGIGYGFRWGDIVLDYRHLAYNNGGDALVQNLTLSGGRLGFVFRF